MLDAIVYLQHVMFHALPTLWRVHRVHHVDLDFDVTTGLRFHPLEILLSMGIKITAVVLLGAPAIAVIIFELLLNATSMFNHCAYSFSDNCSLSSLSLLSPHFVGTITISSCYYLAIDHDMGSWQFLSRCVDKSFVHISTYPLDGVAKTDWN